MTNFGYTVLAYVSGTVLIWGYALWIGWQTRKSARQVPQEERISS